MIGGSIANLIGTGDIMELNVIGFIIAVLCSIGLLAVAERADSGNPPTANDSAAPSGRPLLVAHATGMGVPLAHA